jgi:hypothetical protein
MASSINASTTGAGGVITTADASGTLNLQSGGTTMATVNASGFSVPTGSTINAANTFGFKNRIINGGMTIDQRNAGASVTPSSGTSQYVLDRYQAVYSVNSKFSVQQNAGSVTPPAGFINYMGITSLSAYSAAGEIYSVQQRIEGLNVADLGWGTANAKTVTLSLWVYSSLTGTFGGSLQNSAANRSYPYTYTVSSANTWTQVSVTIAGDTSGTWLTTNGVGVTVNFNLGSGSTWAGTAGAWAAADYRTATSANSIIGTSGATFYITGVQLEVGSQATSFDFRDYGCELMLCQRYFQKTTSGYFNAVQSDGYGRAFWFFKVSMRTTPTNVGGAGTVGSDNSTGTDGLNFNTAAGTAYIGPNTTSSAEL